MSEINLNEISAADFLAAVEDGTIDLDSMSVESEKVAEEEIDLSEISTEDLLAALEELEGSESEKTAEAQYFEDVGRMMARGYADELTKVANGGLDLNELSVDEFIEYAAHLEDEMTKEALAIPVSVRKGYNLARKFGKDIATGSGAKKHFSKARKAHKQLKEHEEIGTAMVANKHKLHNLKERSKRGRNKQLLKSGLYASGTGGLYTGGALAAQQGYKKFKKSRK